ncbi:hypothetical protein VMCG_06108 [Cytospora schulzeri]|uniref:Uncharacterized protein n=1 Tax=Cytospora schulzeri TaxID=448051 RepID=A0A423WGG4_9PEZI|nr:hypothetical protein VMCG_06108 [Valsa malicola]
MMATTKDVEGNIETILDLIDGLLDCGALNYYDAIAIAVVLQDGLVNRYPSSQAISSSSVFSRHTHHDKKPRQDEKVFIKRDGQIDQEALVECEGNSETRVEPEEWLEAGETTQWLKVSALEKDALMTNASKTNTLKAGVTEDLKEAESCYSNSAESLDDPENLLDIPLSIFEKMDLRGGGSINPITSRKVEVLSPAPGPHQPRGASRQPKH